MLGFVEDSMIEVSIEEILLESSTPVVDQTSIEHCSYLAKQDVSALN